jgi:adhesin transport system outer membrane protein
MLNVKGENIITLNNQGRRYCCTVVLVCWLMGAMNASAVGLSALIELAVASNPAAKNSRALLAAAQANIDTAQWQYYPTPQFSVTSAAVGDNDQSYLGDDYSASIGLTQPLWSGGLISSELREAEYSYSVSDATNLQVLQDLGLEVLSAYTNWRSANLRVAAWQRSLKIHQRLYNQVKRRVTGGASSDSDLALAWARVLQTEAELVSAVADEEVAIADLVELVGQPLTISELITEQAQPIKLLGSKTNLTVAAQQTNPLIIKAVAEMDLAEAEINTVKATRMPQINLRIERQFGDLSFANTAPTNRVFVEVSSRFGAGLSGASQTSAARLRRDAALANVDVQRRQLNAVIATDYALKQSVDRRIIALQRSEQANKEVYESFERQFLSGSRSWLDLLNAARELTQTEVRLADVTVAEVLVTWRLSIISTGLGATLEKAL